MIDTPDQTPAAIEPDTKDWTFVTTDGCEACGFRPQPAGQTGELLRATVGPWQQVLGRGGVRTRPAPTTWSPLEYGAHVRDVLDVFSQRLVLMLGEQDPTFDDWDQDAAAVRGLYHAEDPAQVAKDLATRGDALADAFDAVQPDQWQRTGRRSNGSTFTVETLGTYCLHDVVHHLHDVGGTEPAVV